MTAPLDTAQVAAAFNVNVRTVHRWAKVGLLPVLVKVRGLRGALLFDPAVVQRALGQPPP